VLFNFGLPTPAGCAPPIQFVPCERLIPKSLTTNFDESTRVLVRPIGLDMVEVGGSNPPGPTKRETLAIGAGFSFEG